MLDAGLQSNALPRPVAKQIGTTGNLTRRSDAIVSGRIHEDEALGSGGLRVSIYQVDGAGPGHRAELIAIFSSEIRGPTVRVISGRSGKMHEFLLPVPRAAPGRENVRLAPSLSSGLCFHT
jgi:hypothetical protein